MVLSTTIIRISDGLLLAASTDDDNSSHELNECKAQTKLFFRKLSPESEPRCSIESGKFFLHYLLEQDICYLTICEKSYPRKLAFSYLEELSREFFTNYGNEYHKPGLRPYAFIKFDEFIQKTKKIYQDSRATDNLSKLNEDLQDVTRIMTKNMEDLLWRGDSLDRMNTLSDQLRDQSLKYRKDAQHLNWLALYRKYGIPLIIIVIVMSVFLVRYYFL
ncbi:snare-like protein [Conidiobolus coronatus NRRL 28638]|uniref:Protein transport protein SEC22 n=1 Tax=Conidiobolus coronatus (strain ATCC 28846 / CBS 209.66 / NRRL 28638) TaxID=796925 RepID=A0A137PDM6_CONC2|nr:snare-like protein [Conidiobolus coronatus NRRL 28638]|eukprot:KXN73090.1 snare-like protein [Conidiobolus coronatus NRRL 28638]